MHFLRCCCRSFRTSRFHPFEDVASMRHPTAGPPSGGSGVSRRPWLARTVAAEPGDESDSGGSQAVLDAIGNAGRLNRRS